MKRYFVCLIFAAALILPLQASATRVANESIQPASLAAGEEVTISFELLESPAFVSIDISKDQPVLHTIDCGLLGLGPHTVTWNGKDSQGNFLPPGDYVIDIIANTYDFQLETCQIWGQFCVPHDIVFDAGTCYFATDTDFHRVITFFSDSEYYGELYGPGWLPGSAPGQFNTPRGITLIKDKAGNRNLVVADSLNHRIQIITLSVQNRNPAYYVYGSEGSGEFKFQQPWDVAASAWNEDLNGCYLYVLDTGNCRVQQFSVTFPGKYPNAGGPKLDFIQEWGEKGSEDGEFYVPEGIAVGPDGSVYVADTGNHRLQKFTSKGNFVAKTGSKGSKPGQFSRPSDVAVSNNGLVFVADSENQRIQYFTESFAVMKAWDTKLPQGMSPIAPASVALNEQGQLFITWPDNIAFCPAVLGYKPEQDVNFRTILFTITDPSSEEPEDPGTDEPVPPEEEPEEPDVSTPGPPTGCGRSGSSMLFPAFCGSLLLLRRKKAFPA